MPTDARRSVSPDGRALTPIDPLAKRSEAQISVSVDDQRSGSRTQS